MQNLQVESPGNATPASLTGQPSAMTRRPRPLFVGSDIYRKAAFGFNHPLNIVRHAAVVDLLRMLGWLRDEDFCESKPANVARLLEFHDRAYIKALQYANSTGRVEPAVRDRYQVGTFENPLFDGLFERASMTVGGSFSP